MQQWRLLYKLTTPCYEECRIYNRDKANGESANCVVHSYKSAVFSARELPPSKDIERPSNSFATVESNARRRSGSLDPMKD